jgi:membrane-bound lytic murein transglycosylase D
VREPYTYGVQLSPVANAPYFTAVELASPVDLAQLAARAGVDEAVLVSLNPAFLRKKTIDGPNHLLVPRDQVRQVSVSLANLQRESTDPPTEALAVSATPIVPSVRLRP